MLVLTDVVSPNLLARHDASTCDIEALAPVRFEIVSHPLIEMATRARRWSAGRVRRISAADLPLTELAPPIAVAPRRGGVIRVDIRVMLILATGIAGTGRITIGDPRGSNPVPLAANLCLVFPASSPITLTADGAPELLWIELDAESKVTSPAARSILFDIGYCCALLDLLSPGEQDTRARLRAVESGLLNTWVQS